MCMTTVIVIAVMYQSHLFLEADLLVEDIKDSLDKHISTVFPVKYL